MKQSLSLVIFAALLLLVVNGCNKDKYYIFNDIPRIQFGPHISALKLHEYTDSLKSETFYYKPQNVKKDTIYFDIFTIGEKSKSDRSYKLQQTLVPDAENAIPGKHYIGFDEPSVAGLYVIKADSVHARVPIVILRDEELKEKTITLRFTVVPNENFNIGEPKKAHRRLLFTDRLSRPAAWNVNYSTNYFGDYSRRKHEFMVEITGEKWDQEFISGLETYQLNFYKSVLAMAVIDYNDKHQDAPLSDENENLITFPN